MTLLDVLKEQKEHKISGQIYELTQIELAFNSNKIEGSTVTLQEAGILYTDNIVPKHSDWNDVVEMKNHFELFDYMLDTADKPLTEAMIKQYHKLLKKETDDSKLDWFAVGDYKKVDNVVGNSYTVSAKDTPKAMKSLLEQYGGGEKDFEEIVDFHARFEHIHPFQDGNGRIGRIILFKECLRNNITPIVVLDRQKVSYINGLEAYNEHPKKLLRTMERFQKQYGKAVERLATPLMERKGLDSSESVDCGIRDNNEDGEYVRPHFRNGKPIKGYWRRRRK